MSIPSNRSISICFVKALIAKSNLSESAKQSLLLEANINPASLETERTRVSPAQFAQLYELICLKTLDFSLGYYQRPVTKGVTETMARYCREADNLLQAVERNVEFYNLFETGFRLSFQLRDRYAFYRMEPTEENAELDTWLYEHHLMVSHRIFCWLTGTPFPLLRVNLGYAPPAHREEYHYLFHCEYRFEQSHHEMIFDRQYLNLPLVRGPAELEDYLRRMPYEFLKVPEQESSYTTQIRKYLKRALPALPSYDQIANSLGLTPQTLRRRLALEGCDYRQLKSEFLRETAISMLNDAHADITSISYQLGFSEPSAFIRSFKSWTGTTPHAYRQSVLQ
ncbi:AraC family transcriptional regulator [Spongiibacter sp. KMU-158]|uniref:AraC family transcriptional regulator n=1 Tax=Spongiibacter pelagi TaxID=2760804 RepID=A0A927GWA2_9GAMM|nr:AraC family transcriptional regulator [Spongiibacter pelagi]MBD2858918.1 AraC family transcriptional regulator [Spongiibacter pelagi]